MNGYVEAGGSDAVSPAYGGGRDPKWAAGLPLERPNRGLHRACASGIARFRASIDLAVVRRARSSARRGGNALAGWLNSLHRGPFTSMI